MYGKRQSLHHKDRELATPGFGVDGSATYTQGGPPPTANDQGLDSQVIARTIRFFRTARATILAAPGIEHLASWLTLIAQHGDHPGHPFF